MPKPRINKAATFEDGSIVLMDRVLGAAGTPITQASIASISLAVFECATEEDAVNAIGEQVGDTASLTVSDHVYDDLQTDDLWTADGDGYNFRYDVGATQLPTGGRWYRFEFKFTPSTGGPFFVVWAVLAEPVASS